MTDQIILESVGSYIETDGMIGKERYPDAVKLHIQLGLATELGVQNHITEITL
tara:strand:- start:414 stop:572 length:159 start_codon:yes stop_codon:yes gene_type:complete